MEDTPLYAYPLRMPERPGFQSITWENDSVVAVTESPFTLTTQTYVWPGQRWAASIRLPQMEPSLAREWMAFFTGLNGREGTFLLSDSKFARIQSSRALGEPRYTAPAEGSTRTIRTEGWTPNKQELLKAGDMIAFDGRLRRVLADASSDEDGNSIIHVWPNVKSNNAAYGCPIEWRNPVGTFRLNDAPNLTWNLTRFLDSIEFGCTEVLP